MDYNFFGIPFWVWIIITIVLFYYYKNSNGKFSNQEPNKIYNFNTSWCGWSRKFQPEWDKFTNMIKEKNVNFIAVDIKCDDDRNENLCKEFNVPGYPSVVAMVNGKPINYNGSRDAVALFEFITNFK